MTTPSLELAKRIVDRLMAERLLVPADADTTMAKLAAGKLNAEDWRLAVEKAVEEKSQTSSPHAEETRT
jgi:hypothetical protein